MKKATVEVLSFNHINYLWKYFMYKKNGRENTEKYL